MTDSINSTQQTVRGKRLYSLSEVLINSKERARVVGQLKGTDKGFKRAVKLLRKVLKEHQLASNLPAVAEVADEISVLFLSALQIPARRVKAALPYLELANNIEKASNPRSALIAARKAVIGEILVQLPHYVDGKGNVLLGTALKAKALKSFKNCDLSKIDLARLMALMSCVQWLKDDINTGLTGQAAEALRTRPNWSVASPTNIINGVSEPDYDGYDEPTACPCPLTPNAETIEAMESARQGDLTEVGDISDLFHDLYSD